MSASENDGTRLQGSTLGLTSDGELVRLSVGGSVGGDPAGQAGGIEAISGTDRYTEDGTELGRGGIGRVYAAFDRQLGREVAVKVLLTEGAGTDGNLSAVERRFVHEARITGQLEHPAIVPVHELGSRPDGSLYYTMKRVRGRTLGEAIRSAGSLEARLGLLSHVLDACQALAYAHSRGVVHRDLKPANVMVGGFGDTVVLDWGLAKHVGDAPIEDDRLARELATLSQVNRGQTVVGTALGTPAYMSPEQARGEVDAIDARSDVWGLGTLIYEVLCNRPPYVGDPTTTMERAQKGEVVPVVQQEPQVPPDLAAIVDKALARDPEDRYPDAAGLAEDLESWMQGRRVRAFRYGTLDLLKRLVLRNRPLSAAVALGLVASVVGGIALFDAWRIAEARAVEAAANEREAHASLSVAYAERAHELLDGDSPTEAAVFAAAAMLHSPHVPDGPWFDPAKADRMELARLRGLVADARDLHQVEHVATWGPAGRRIRYTEVSADGRYAAVQRGGGNVDIVDLDSGTIAHRVQIQTQTIQGLAWLADGTLLVPSADALELQIITPDGKVVRSFPHRLQENGLRMVTSVDATPDGSRIVLQAEGWVVVFDGIAGTFIHAYGSIDFPSGLVLAPDGERLLLPGQQHQAALYETTTGRIIRDWKQHSVPTDAVFVGEHLVVATPQGLRTFAASDGAPLELRTDVAANRVSLSGDGTTLLVDEPGGPALRDAHTFERIEVLPRPTNGRHVFAELGGNRRMLIAESGVGGFLLSYRRRERAPARFQPPILPIALAASPDGAVIGVGDPSTAVVLDATTGELRARVDSVTGPYALPGVGGDTLVVTDAAHHLALFDTRDPANPTLRAPARRPAREDVILMRFPGVGPGGGEAALSTKGLVAFSKVPGPVVLYDLQTGEAQGTLPLSETVEQVVFSHEGDRVAVCGGDAVRTYAVPAIGLLDTWVLPRPCASVAWSPDGERLVAADANGGVQQLDPGGEVSDPQFFPPPLKVGWPAAGVLVEEATQLHLLDDAGIPYRTLQRRETGASHTLATVGTSGAVWFGEGQFVRRADLAALSERTPQERLDRAQEVLGLRLQGFKLELERREPPPAMTDPRILNGKALTSDQGYVVHGRARLIDRQTLEPFGEPSPIRHDGTFALRVPPGVDAEVGVLLEAAGYPPHVVLAPWQRAGGQAVTVMLTASGSKLIHALTGNPRQPGTSSLGVFAQYTDGTRAPAPVGCAVISAEPELRAIYTAGSGDSALSSRPHTHPREGIGVMLNVPQVPHTLTVTAGDRSESIDLPVLPPDYAATVFVPFMGSDPTPEDCH